MEVLLFISKHWKQILLAIILIAIIGYSAYGGWKYRDNSANTEIAELKTNIVVLTKERDDADSLVKILKIENTNYKGEVNKYVISLAKIKIQKEEVEKDYYELLKNINSEKIPFINGRLVKPYVIISSGVPTLTFGEMRNSEDNNSR